MATSIGNPSAQQGAMQVLHSRKLRDVQFHPFAEIFPPLEGKAFEEMVADMVDHGVREPIWIDEGRLHTAGTAAAPPSRRGCPPRAPLRG